MLLVKLCIYDTTWKVVVHLINFTCILFFVCFWFHRNHKLLVWFANVTLIVCLESVKSGPYSNDHIGWNYFLLFFPNFNVSFLLKSWPFFMKSLYKPHQHMKSLYTIFTTINKQLKVMKADIGTHFFTLSILLHGKNIQPNSPLVRQCKFRNPAPSTRIYWKHHPYT